jgi:hypothetical protein
MREIAELRKCSVAFPNHGVSRSPPFRARPFSDQILSAQPLLFPWNSPIHTDPESELME